MKTKEGRDHRGRIFLLLAGLALALPVFSAHAQAQNLQLFEPVETPNADSAGGETVARNPRESRAAAAAPQFTLVGTTRIGNSYKALLQRPDGETVVVQGQPDSQVLVPGYSDYQVQGFGSRQVAVVYPSGLPCVSFEDQGVSCGPGNTARLSLTTAEPIAVSEPEPAREQQAEGEPATEEPSNPFAAALRRAANQDPEDAANARAEAQRFQLRRIAPEDVPEGMRVVRTPFGDRLVEM